MPIVEHDADQRALLSPDESLCLLGGYGIQIPEQRAVETPMDAVEAAEAIGYPVVVKAAGAALVHKSEVGGVRLDLRTAEEVREAAAEMAAAIAGLEAFVVQAMAPQGVEMLVGARRDPVFGPVVLVGAGGVLAELLDDVVVRSAPVSESAAAAMVSELDAVALLDGYRGADPADRRALARVIAETSRLIAEQEEVAELDFNPVIVHGAGAVAVDLRLIRGPRPEPQHAREPAGPVIERMLRPRSVVVAGASRNVSKQGGRLMRYLLKHGYDGKVYVVNPGATEVMGCPSVPTVADLPETPDLACIAVPAASVPETIEECGRLGIPAAVVCTAGFAEAGEEGRALQDRLAAATRRSGIRICGPNTAGVVSTPAKLCATFGMAFEVDEMPAGPVAVVTQSGALGGSLLSRLWSRGVGFSHWVSVGNEADLQLGDYLLWLADDPDTRIISVFMESVRDATLLRDGCHRAAANGKPVLVYKTGYSAAGRRAVQSHTAALAGDGAVYDAVLDELGVVRCPDLQTLIDASVALAWQPLPAGRRVGVVSASGGACSVVADECSRHGLEVPPLSARARERVAELIPAFGSAENPVDVTMEITVRPTMIGEVLDVMLDQDDLDAVVVMLTTNADPPAIDVAEGVIRAARTTGKPVLVCRMGAEFLAPRSLALYREAEIPVYPMPDMAVRSLKAAADFGERRHAIEAT